MLMVFKNLADMSLRHMSTSYEQKTVFWLSVRFVDPLLFDQNQCYFQLNESKVENVVSFRWLDFCAQNM